MTHAIKSFVKTYRNFFPQGAGSLFLIQLFSTIGFSSISSSLVLYTTNWLRLSDTLATSIVASFVALTYVMHLLGGLTGGRLLSFRSLFAIGMLFQFLGCVIIATPSTTSLFWGLSAFLTGSGLNIACINCMLTQLFKPNDKHRETAFLINYSCMNVGATIGYFLSGYFHLTNSYQALFLLSGVGNLVALICAAVQWKYLRDIATPLVGLALSKKLRKNLMGAFLIVIFVFLLRWLLDHAELTNNIILALGALMAVVILSVAYSQPTIAARNKMLAFVILAVAALIFWTLYQLAPIGLTLFIERNVERHYLGILVPPQWAQNINPIVIMIGGPLLGILFTKMREHGYRVTVPLQFSLSLLFIGLAFILLPIAIHNADSMGFSSFNWILACYFLQSIGELFIGPIGYAMVGQYAPAHLQGLMMGTWMMISGISAVFSGYFSKMALGVNQSTEPLVTNPSYSHTFLVLGLTALIASVCLFILIPFIMRLTHEDELKAA